MLTHVAGPAVGCLNSFAIVSYFDGQILRDADVNMS